LAPLAHAVGVLLRGAGGVASPPVPRFYCCMALRTRLLLEMTESVAHAHDGITGHDRLGPGPRTRTARKRCPVFRARPENRHDAKVGKRLYFH